MSVKKLFLLVTLVIVVVALVAAPAFAQAPEKAPAAKKPGAKAAKAAAQPAQTPPQKGMVWANTKSKIYHKEGDQFYGKGKNGQWMTEADAVKQGYREARKGGTKAAAKKEEGAAAQPVKKGAKK